jgi:chromate transporter
MKQLPVLARVFAYVSLLTVGGGMAAFPELKTLTVDVHKWLTLEQLVHLYSLGQMAPGPKMMMIVPIGERVAGLAGAAVVLIAFFGPTSLLTLIVGRLWDALARWRWRGSIQKGLAPVSIGLLLAGSLTMARAAITDWITATVALGALVILLLRSVNPALLVLGGAIIGAIVFLPR